MLKVVVVEDEELLRMGLTNFFDWGAYGFELVGEAGNGLKGLEIVREKRPDLVITDIKMPHMSGIEMAETLMQEMPDLQILIISGYDDFEYAKRAIKAGVAEYILKPIKMDNLKEAIAGIQKKLNEREKAKREIEQLKHSHAQSRKANRAALYAKVLIHRAEIDDVTAGHEPKEEGLQDRVCQAGLVAIKNFSVLYMDCDYSTQMEHDHALQRLVDECLSSALNEEQRACVDVLRVTHGERVFCITGKSHEEVRAIQDALKAKIREEPSETEHIEVTFGHASRGLEGLKESYDRARQLSEDSFMRHWQEATGNTGSQGMSNVLNYDLTDLFHAIKNGDDNSVSTAVRAFRDMLVREKAHSYLQVVLAVGNIYNKLIQLPEEAGGNISDVVGDPRLYYQKLIGKMKRDEMLEELEAFCQRLREYYQQFSADRKQEIMRRVESYIKGNYSKVDLSMKDAAEHVYVSVSYLGMIIKRETGKTFTEYLTDIRLERAKQLLTQSNMKNYEIAEACGYATPAYFSTVFRGSMGMTPSEYRAKGSATANQ